MPAKRIINKNDYPMVTPEGWEIYENTRTILPCICQGCGCVVKKSIDELDRQKPCFCKKCGSKKAGRKRKHIINKEDYPMVTPEGWEIYETKKTKLPCICEGCGCIVKKTINQLNREKSCFCRKCGASIKTKRTNFEKYGVESTNQLLEVKEKKKQTTMKNYGVENPSQSTEAKEKAKRTNFEKYGVEHSSQLLEIKEKKKKTNLEKHGVENPSQLLEIKEKKKKTTMKNYGVEHALQLPEFKEKMKKTNIERRGVEHASQSTEFKEKMKKTNIERRGVEYSFQSPDVKEKIRETILKKHGVKNIAQSLDIIKRGLETKRKNNTFHTSKPEDLCYQYLCSLYDKTNVKRNYNKDSRYPFLVDFYIISEDLFIECNFFWSHGDEPFNEKNEKHQQILNEWKNKQKESYNNSIDVWTVRDPLKFKTAKDNNLKYLAFYTMKEFEDYFLKNELFIINKKES